MGGMIIGIKKKIIEKRTKVESVKEEIIMAGAKIKKEKWRNIEIYAERNILKEKLHTLEN